MAQAFTLPNSWNLKQAHSCRSFYIFSMLQFMSVALIHFCNFFSSFSTCFDLELSHIGVVTFFSSFYLDFAKKYAKKTVPQKNLKISAGFLAVFPLLQLIYVVSNSQGSNLGRSVIPARTSGLSSTQGMVRERAVKVSY